MLLEGRRESGTDPSAAAHIPRKNPIIASLTSVGRSCWVQWPQPGRTIALRSFGTKLERFGSIRSHTPTGVSQPFEFVS